MQCRVPYAIPEQNQDLGGKTGNANKAWDPVNCRVLVLLSDL